jgi:hypothetical protein
VWDAKVYALATLIAFFSGAWPYVKLICLFVCLTFPTRYLNQERRETALVIMDILGKWSLIDFYVMILFMSAFALKINLSSPDPVSPQLINKIVINTYVLPKWGIYSFLIATISALSKSALISTRFYILNLKAFN